MDALDCIFLNRGPDKYVNSKVYTGKSAITGKQGRTYWWFWPSTLKYSPRQIKFSLMNAQLMLD